VQLYRLDCGVNTLSWRLYYWAEPTSAVEAQTVAETLVRLKRALFQTDTPAPQPAAATS
jgi:hypothetical protein